jgi:hypothetical protein
MPYDRPHRSRDCGFPGLRKRNGVSRTTVRIAHENELSEGLPGPREAAYAAKRSHDGEAPAAFE